MVFPLLLLFCCDGKVIFCSAVIMNTAFRSSSNSSSSQMILPGDSMKIWHDEAVSTSRERTGDTSTSSSKLLQEYFPGSNDDNEISKSNNYCVRSKKSFMYRMLNSKSNSLQARIYKIFISTIIIVDFMVYVLSTEPDLTDGTNNGLYFYLWDAIVSHLFLVEYLARLFVVTESKKYGRLGPLLGRLQYSTTFPAIIDLVSFLPFFIDWVLNMGLPKLTWLRSIRLIRILKTSGFAQAADVVQRVLYYNRQILHVAILICVGTTIITAVSMYYLRPPDDYNDDDESQEFRSLSSTIYLSTLLLTGQGGPNPANLPWYTKGVVFAASILSIAMFALPSSILTWSFVAEAERMAKLAYKQEKRKPTVSTRTTTQEEQDDEDLSDSTDSYSTDEEYLKILSGYEEEQDARPQSKAEIANLREVSVSSQNQADECISDRNEDLATQVSRIEKTVKEQSEKLDMIVALLEVHLLQSNNK